MLLCSIVVLLNKGDFMGKRKSIRKGYQSKGERRNVKPIGSVWSEADRMIFKAEARRKGKRTVETIPNPNKNETNKRFIKVVINGK